MENHLTVDISNGGFLYQLFYILGFLVAYIIILYEGYRRNFPVVKWVLILACIRLFVVSGTKLFSFSPDEWKLMFQTGALLPNPQKTMFGGIILGVAGYLLTRYLLKFRYSVWDTVAIAFPAGVAIQSFGCFFYGCCYGTPSHAIWAVRYPVMSLAHYHQFESGLLTFKDHFSLPVHPVQLYECMGALFVVILVLILKKHLKAQGSALLSTIVLFSVVRMIIEFFRDPLSNKTGGEMLWIMKQVQWQYLFAGLLAGAALFLRERKFSHSTKTKLNDIPLPGTEFILLLSLLTFFVLLRKWFTLSEIIAIDIAFLPAVALTARELYVRTSRYRYRWVYACSIILPLFLMSQTFPQTQIDPKPAGNYETYHTIGLGYATGNYTDERMNYSGSGCDMVSNREYFSEKYSSFGGGYSFTKVDQERDIVIRYGADIMAGDFRGIRQSDNMLHKLSLWSVTPYIKFDSKWIGVGGGLHLGNLEYSLGDTRKKFDSNPPVPEKGSFRTPVLPRVYLRVGVARYFFGDFHLADQFPVSAPGLAFQAGIGSGFGLKNGLNLRGGLSFLENAGYYVSGYFPIDNRIVIEPLFLWTGKYEKELYTVRLPENQFSIAISYRFGNKQAPGQ